ncbi:hypothetical protein GCM10027341_41300 [Spirosoma knui]
MLVSPLALAQNPLYVTPSGNGSGDGSSWDNALPGTALQGALATAPSGTTVLVAGGLYKPTTTTTDRTASFSLAAGVEVYGGYTAGTNNRTTNPSSTTLSGDLNGNDTYDQSQASDVMHVVTMITGSAVLDGLVITQGEARSSDPAYNAPNNSGGGLLMLDGSLTLRSVDFVKNVGRTGAGMCVKAGSVNLTNCIFRENNSQSGDGGGLYVNDGVTGSLTNCEFLQNSTIFGNASAMFLEADNFTLTGCRFVGKPGPVISNADPDGGGLYVSTAKGVVLTNCVFSSNNGVRGGAIYNRLSDVFLLNCTFSGNRSYFGGSALYSDYGRFWLFNSIIWGNQSELGGSAYAKSDPSFPIINYSYTDTQDGVQPGTGNLSVDPLFVDAANGDFRLSACSPLVDAGNSTISYTVGNLVSFTLPDTDLAGNPRRVRTIDLGAYEFQGSPTVGIAQQPANATAVCAGATVTASISTSGTVNGYQWYKDNSSLGTAQQSATLTLTNVSPAQAGSYLVVVTGNCNSVTSTAFSLAVSPYSTATLYVTPSGNGSGDGSSWDNALPGTALQGALATAPSGTTVLVAGGLYKPTTTTTDRTASFSLAAGVEVYGGYTAGTNNRTTNPSSTTLSGDLNGNDTYDQSQASDVMHVVTMITGSAVLDGLVITQGEARSSDPAYNAPNNSGGGLLMLDGSLTLRSVDFVKNVGRTGAGMCVKAGSVNLTNCIFRENNSQSGDGGGLYVNDGVTGSLTNCEFLQNSTIFGNASAMFLEADNFTLTGCRFVGKPGPVISNADPDGGGLYVSTAKGVVLTNCVFSSNNGVRGGAIYNRLSDVFLLNCTFSGNRSYFGGSALYSDYGRFWLFNSIIWGNQSELGGSAYAKSDPSFPIINYSYTDTQDGVQPGTGNLSVDPLFVDAANGDFRLSACSPLVDAGNSTISYTVGNLVSFTLPDTDLAGNPRRVRTIDLGAYEFQGSPTVGIAQQPANATAVCAGATVTASISTSGTVNSYQWYKDNSSLGTAQQSATLTLTNVSPAQAGSYLVVVTGNCNSVTSTAFNLSVNPTPSVSLSATGPLTCSQLSVSLVATSPDQGSYTFVGPGLNQTGSASTATATQGGLYSVTLTTTSGCSSTATTEVTSSTISPSISLTNTGPLSFTNTSVTLTATATPSGSYSYTFSNGAAQQGNSNKASVTTAGVYSVTVTRQDNGCSTIASTTVTGGNNPTVCRGGTAVINVVVEGDPVKYEWYKNSLTSPKLMETPQLFRGTATSSLTLINAQTNTQGNFFLKVTDRSGTVRVYGPYRLTVDANCRAREIASLETPLQVELAPNPIQQDRLRAIVRGAEGRSLQVELVDVSGRSIRQQQWQQADSQQLIDWNIQGQASGMYLLQVVSEAGNGLPAQRQSVKVIKP